MPRPRSSQDMPPSLEGQGSPTSVATTSFLPACKPLEQSTAIGAQDDLLVNADLQTVSDRSLASSPVTAATCPLGSNGDAQGSRCSTQAYTTHSRTLWPSHGTPGSAPDGPTPMLPAALVEGSMPMPCQGLHELSRESSDQSLSADFRFDDESLHDSTAPEMGSHEVSLASLSSADASHSSNEQPLSLIRVLAGGMLLPSEFRDEGFLQHATGGRQSLPRSVTRENTLPPWPTRKAISGMGPRHRTAQILAAQQHRAAHQASVEADAATLGDETRQQSGVVFPPSPHSPRISSGRSSGRFSLESARSVLTSLHLRGSPWKSSRSRPGSVVSVPADNS